MNYYVYQNEQTAGPYTKDQLAEMSKTNAVTPETPCCEEGAQSWQTVANFLNGAVATTASAASLNGHFSQPKYMVRRKILKLLGGAFHVYDPAGAVVGYSELKAFKLKEDIRLFSGEDKQKEVMRISARKILDFSSAYDVVDSSTNEKVGALKRKGLKSILKDEWIILDANDRELGLIQEDNLVLALLRRFVLNWIPQNYSAKIGESQVGSFKQNLNPFVMKINVDFSKDPNQQLDRRLGMAAAILFCAVEGKEG
jgi:hypothetical protein